MATAVQREAASEVAAGAAAEAGVALVGWVRVQQVVAVVERPAVELPAVDQAEAPWERVAAVADREVPMEESRVAVEKAVDLVATAVMVGGILPDSRCRSRSPPHQP